MHSQKLHQWEHDHTFGQDQRRQGERRTLIVIVLTATMMFLEISVGVVSGSMALLADGLHMGSHTVALGISAVAYRYARLHARDPRFAFGTGKVNALGGFTGAVLLGVFALLMAFESFERLANPVAIAFNEAIIVAVLGLIVNGISIVALGAHSHSDASAGHDHDHDHHHHDQNLRSAYLHVLADALTSFLAIFALLSARFFGLVWMDPLMGVVGACLVTRWSWSLLRETTAVLLDHQAPEPIRQAVRDAVEKDGDDRVTDLHVWSVAPGQYAAILGLVTHAPQTADAYKRRLPANLGLAHTSIEVHHCDDPHEDPHGLHQVPAHAH